MIAIIGGGITGLSLGWMLKAAGLECRVFEATAHAGGNIRSFREQGFLLDRGPNSLQLNDFLMGVIERLGLKGELLTAAPEAKRRYVLRDQGYKALPSGPGSLLLSSLFSFRTKRGVLRERKVPVGKDPLETVDAFFRRRLGDEVADFVVAPFVSGIFAGDTRELLIAEAFPRVKEWEEQYGSLLKAFGKARKAQQHRGTVSFREGMEALPRAMMDKLGDWFCGEYRLERLERQVEGKRYRLHFKDQDAFEADQVVLALPASAVAGLIRSFNPALAARLEKVYYPPVALVHSVYPSGAIRHRLDGFGALHNHLEASETLGTIFSSTVFPNRANGAGVVLATFVGGARHPEKALQSEAQIEAGVRKDLARFLGASGNPLFQTTMVWPKAIPQYDQGILPVRELEAGPERDGLWLAGNWKGGISVVNCIQHAEALCEKLKRSGRENK